MNVPAQRYDRYPGTRPFADNKAERKLFFGRDHEIRELLHQILSTNLLVVYGKSGLGKTSLLQAGIFPRLRERDLLPLPIRLNDLEQPPLDLFIQAITDQCHRDNIDYTPGEPSSLWEFFKTVLFLRGETLQLPVLVVDQFEELFTLQDDHRRAVIAQELADLTSARLPEKIRSKRRAGVPLPYSDRPPEVKIVLVLREDYLGILQELTGKIPTILDQRYRLTAFDERQARAAMEEPARVEDEHLFNTPIFRYEANVISQMLTFLQGRSGIIEPFQLQILCQYVEQQVRQQQADGQSQVLVNESYIGDDRSMEMILQNFYKDAVQKVSTKRQRKRAYRLCEEGLLNYRGQRLSLEEGELKRTYKVSSETLDTLVDVRLLRKEPRLESFYYEISHDSMAQSVANSRRFRIPKQVWYGGAACIVLILFGFLSIAQQLRVTALRAEQAEIREKFLSDQLAKNFWNKALHERDENHDPLKASHYFMRAAKHATQPGVAKNAQLAGAVLVQNSALSAILAFDGGISDAGFQSDGKGVRIQSGDGTTYLWDVKTSTVSPVPSVEIKNGSSESSKTVWSPDGKQFLTWHSDGTAELRDYGGTVVTEFLGHEKAIWGAAFHPNGEQILTWGADGTARLWNPVTATALTLQHAGVVRGAMYSPDGHRVLTWSDDRTARVWDHDTGNPLTAPLSHKRRVWGAVFSADGNQILTWSEDGTACVWHSSSGKALTESLTHKASVEGAIFDPKGKWVLTWSDDRTARMWDSTTGIALTPPLYHPGVMGASLSPEGRQILTWSPDGTVRLWAYIPDKVLSLPLRPQPQVRRLAFSPEGDYILTLDSNSGVQLWDSTTGAALPLPPASKQPFRGAIFRPNSKQILAWTDDGSIRLWRVVANEPHLLPNDHTGTTWDVAFSPDDRSTWGAVFSSDGKQLLTWGDAGAGTASLWNHPRRTPPPITQQGRVRGAIFTPDGQQILTWSLNETARMWDSQTGAAITPRLTHKSPVRGAQFSPDGNRILTWTADGSLQLWDRRTRTLLPLTLTDTGAVRGAAFSPDGFRLLTWDRKENLRLWDLATGAVLTPSFPHQGQVRHAAISPNGLRILALDKQGAVRVWTLPVADQFRSKHFDLELDVRTGTQLNDRDELEFLSLETWKGKKEVYDRSIQSLRSELK
jgi:WD40 repeat protein